MLVALGLHFVCIVLILLPRAYSLWNTHFNVSHTTQEFIVIILFECCVAHTAWLMLANAYYKFLCHVINNSFTTASLILGIRHVGLPATELLYVFHQTKWQNLHFVEFFIFFFLWSCFFHLTSILDWTVKRIGK